MSIAIEQTSTAPDAGRSKRGPVKGVPRRQGPPAPTEALRVGAIVRQARKRNRMTQQALARVVGVTNTAVAQWERGHAVPLLQTRLALVKILGIPIGQLIPREVGRNPLVVTDPEMIQIVQAIRLWRPEQRTAFRVALTMRNEPPALD